ncbi:hypothetical protein QFC19_000774 [Naganishia cerealis]|uniref:Uncharacterized protein n=1 Tax=Naganishia cerealis TaxID=610337 RepID=A0ACC2WMB1_9TREE|nr:hypothetical protein QFC19_000774 [Naganishia cerealis]
MSDEEFDDFSIIDDDALTQIASIEQSVGNSHGNIAARNPLKSGLTTWSLGQRAPAGKAPAFRLRTGPLPGNARSSSSSESNGPSVVSAAIRPSTTINDTRVAQGSTTTGRSSARNVGVEDTRIQPISRGDTNVRMNGASSREVNPIEVLSDGDDPEIEVCSPPPGSKSAKDGFGQNNSGINNHSVSAAEAARIARANAIRGMTRTSNGDSNWLTNAQNNRQNGPGEKTNMNKTNSKTTKVAEWDPEKPQTQVVQTHLPFRPITPRKTGKTWDRTAYSKSGQRIVKKGSAKKKAVKKKSGGGGWDDEASGDDDMGEEEEEEEEEESGFDQFPMPFIDPSKHEQLALAILEHDLINAMFVVLGKYVAHLEAR